MRIQKSAEDYLEMILRLHETKGYARAIDISCGLSVTKPSVSVAMRNLRENGYITVDDDKHIHLTELLPTNELTQMTATRKYEEE